MRIQFTAKPKSNFPRAHGFVAVVHLPRLRRALADDFDGGTRIEPRALGEMETLGQSLNEPGNADLIDHFGELARPRRSHQPAGLGIGKDDPFGPPVIVRFTAAHDAERTCFGAGLTAGYWGIDKAKSLGFRNRVKVARDDRRGGCVIEKTADFSRLSKAPSTPVVTARRSSSFPTQAKTNS